ncbi:MAG: PDZ domain-containing protein, partial [Calditrichaeota bacterium]
MRSLAVSIFVGVFLSLWAQSPASLQEQIFYARDRVLPALVHIEPIKKVYTRGEKQHTLVTGSGFIFSREGYVMTNHHVAANAEKVWCTLYNKERITATVVGSDQSTDIAILKLNLEELQDTTFAVATLGNSDSLEVGQIVLALGSPLGLSRSVSMGVVSSIDRYFPTRGTSMDSPYNLWIQTDAAINPGNSGGPLINLHGEVVGINARAVFLAENLGFAIPINLAREIAAQILERSSVKRAWLGVDFKPIKDLREYLEMPHLSGVLVTHVERNSPAEKVGLQPGDVIRQIGDQPVNALFEEDLPGIRKIIATLPIGEKIPLHIWRNGKSKTLRVAVIEEPLDSDAPEIEAEEWGLVVRGLSWQAYRVQLLPDFNGVEITSVKPAGPGEQANLRSGDVIRKINGVVVKNG